MLSVAAIPVAIADVVLYQGDDFRGRSIPTDREIENLNAMRFSAVASSIEVRSGTWQVCDDAGYRGRCETLRPGRYSSLGAMGLNDRVSSVRPSYGKPGSGGGYGDDRDSPEVTLNRNGAGSVYFATNDGRLVYDPRSRRTTATNPCQRDQLVRADEAMARYRSSRGLWQLARVAFVEPCQGPGHSLRGGSLRS